MPFHDLSVVYTNTHSDLNHTLLFHQELGYSIVAVTISITGKLPPTPPTIPLSTLTTDPNLHLTLLTRLNLTISDATQNHRLTSLTPHYNILALRPTNEKTLQLCCSSLDCDLISLDFTHRLPFILKFKTVASALQRGVRFEICYAAGVGGSPGQAGVSVSDARRNLISGAASLVRATRGRGIIISSEARNALGVRGPWDIVNLAQLWGLSRERAKEALCEEAGKVVRLAAIRRSSYRGVVDVIRTEGEAGVEMSKGAGEARKGVKQQQEQIRGGEKASLKRKLSTKSAAGDEVNNATTTVGNPSDPIRPTNTKTTTTTTTATPTKPKSDTTTSHPPHPQHETQQKKPREQDASLSVSKRELKRRAKKARLLNGNGGGNGDT